MGYELRVLDLFSGIGGFSLGLERAGMRTVAFCEIEPYCRAVLRKHWPDVRCYENITHLGPAEVESLGAIDVVCGGFPCQPFSLAGQRRGDADDRHLWPKMRSVITYAQPSWVIGENVAGLISMGLDEVLFDLEAIGYTSRTFVIPACALDAPHRRDRVWIVAHAAGGTRQRQAPRETGYAALCGEDVANDDRGDGGASGPDQVERWATDLAESGSELGQHVSWPIEPDVGRVAHGVPARVDRLRALGNAVVPQIPEIIGRAIMNAEAMRDARGE